MLVIVGGMAALSHSVIAAFALPCAADAAVEHTGMCLLRVTGMTVINRHLCLVKKD